MPGVDYVDTLNLRLLERTLASCRALTLTSSVSLFIHVLYTYWRAVVPFSLITCILVGLRDAVQRLFEEETPQRVVTTNYRKDGSRFKNLLTLGPIYDATGKMTHCVAQLMNVGNVN